MVRLDSIKLKIPLEDINCINYDKMLNVQTLNQDKELLGEIWKNKRPYPLGISGIEIDKSQGIGIVQLSAKVLKHTYAEGINKNNIEQVINEINSIEIIKLNQRSIRSSQLLTVDFTNNIITDDVDIYNKLRSVPLSGKYSINSYNKLKNEGVVIRGNQTSFKERLILYDKAKELLRPQNKLLLKSVPGGLLQKQFINVMRVESNFAQLRKIRECTNTNGFLEEVLHCDEKVNYNLLNKITRYPNKNVLSLFKEYEGKKWIQTLKSIGYTTIIERCNFDWSCISQFVKVNNKHNYRKELIYIRSYYNSMINQTSKTDDLNVLDLIRDLLLNAA